MEHNRRPGGHSQVCPGVGGGGGGPSIYNVSLSRGAFILYICPGGIRLQLLGLRLDNVIVQ